MYGQTRGYNGSQIHQSSRKQFRGINAKSGVLPRKSTQFYCVAINNQEELDRFEDFVFQRNLAAGDYTEEGTFPKMLVAPMVDELTDRDFLRIYDTTWYQEANILDTVFAEISTAPKPRNTIRSVNESIARRQPEPSNGFYAMSKDSFDELKAELRRQGLNTENVLKSIKWVSL